MAQFIINELLVVRKIDSAEFKTYDQNLLKQLKMKGHLRQKEAAEYQETESRQQENKVKPFYLKPFHKKKRKCVTYGIK